MEPVQLVGWAFFPLDEELALPTGRLTPLQEEHLTRLGIWMPFERAAEMMKDLLGVQVSEATVRRRTQQAGAAYEAVQTQAAQASVVASLQGPFPEKLVISTDGAYVPLIQGQWAEVRTLAVGQVAQREEQVQTSHLSYFSRMTDAETFGSLAEVEMRRRGVSQVAAVCAVADGADWIQGFIDLHRPDAVRILDFPHAAEHVTALIEALQQAGVKVPSDALQRSLHILKHRGPGLLLRCCDRFPQPIAEQEAIKQQLQYFRKRLSLLQYSDYQQQGWPIGSGMVESANKGVVQARLKGTGMHWAPAHVNPMLALRTAVCNERWLEAQRETLAEQRSARANKRLHRATTRFQACISSLMLLLLRFQPPTPKSAFQPPISKLAGPATTLPGSCRPSAHHPWKRGPSCRPKLSAKK